MTATISPPPPRPDGASRVAYETIADVYDAFTAHHDCEAWTVTLESLARRHGLGPPGRLLDLGCGTGKSLIPWHDRGWSITACDNSPAMLRHAAAKAPPGVELMEADIRRLGGLGAFELIVMLDDVVNYLAPDELVPAFRGVAGNLADDGLVVFDLNTVHLYRDFFAATQVCEHDGCLVVWVGRARADFAAGEIAEATMDGFVQAPDGRWERLPSLHRQHHHPVALVGAALAEAGLEQVGLYGHDYECNVDETADELRNTKLIVIARRAAP